MPSVFSKEDWATDADVAGLGGAEAVFETAGRLMTGSQGDIFDRVSSGAEEFTDLLSENIKTGASENHEQWATAFFSCMYGQSVVEIWRKAVQKFNSTMETLQEEWDDAISTNFGVEVAPVGDEGRQDDLIEKDQAQELQYSLLKEQADPAREELEEVAEKVRNMLETGPSEEGNIDYLVSKGYLGWAPYAILGPGSPVPIDLDADGGEEMANDLAEAVESGGDVPPAVLYALSYINSEAKRKLETGESFSSDELAFLESFFESMEGKFDVAGYDGPRDLGVLGLTQILEEQGGGKSETLLEELSESLLHLSDEDLGGGIESLPATVQNTAYGPPSYPDGSRQPQAWMSDLERLEHLFSYAGDDTKAGLELSANLTTSIGLNLNDPSFQGQLGGNKPGLLGEYPHEMLDNIIEVSSRNEDANHALLTGEFNYRYEGQYITESNKTPPSVTEGVLEGLYTFDWDFQDARDISATQLTDWISEAALSEDPDKRQLAGESAAGLIENTTTDYMFNALTGTGHKADDINNASFTNLHPELAQSLNEVFLSYIEDFGRESTDGEHKFVTDGENSEALHTDELSRVRFMQFIMADDEAAAEAIARTQIYEAENIGDSLLPLGEEEGHHVLGGRSGRLNGIIEAAIANEAFDRLDDDEAAREREVKLKSLGASVAVDFILGKAESIDFIADPAKHYIGEFAKSQMGNPPDLSDYIENGSPHEELTSQRKLDRQYQIAWSAYNEIFNNPDLITEEGVGFPSESFRGENGQIIDPSDRNLGNTDGYLDALEASLEGLELDIPSNDPQRDNVNAFERVDRYTEASNSAYEEIVDKYRSNSRGEYGDFKKGDSLASSRE
ncbi:hypothetical protein ACIQFP_00625 [Nocardiopsis alba]|uniref:TPR repeat region-containing protein n=1 Tax=Nocardiopsis alba TaxID=53437 RepID=UPI0037F2AACE